MEEDRRFYVYEHIRLDTRTCFYVGKGTGRRAYYKYRNTHHDRIVELYGMEVKIIKDNLTSEEAYKLEEKVIRDYVFNKGYGIDIPGYRKSSSGYYLTNSCFGGDGSKGMIHTEEWCKEHSKAMTGENNPMYGVNVWDTYSDEKKEDVKNKLSNAFSGNKNPMYGISPEERMDKDTYEEWHRKVIERGKSLTGDKNPNYGNNALHEKVKDNPELRIEYFSRPGSQNGRATPILVYDLNDNFIAEFSYIGECCEWMKKEYGFNLKINSMRTRITEAIKNNRPYKNLRFYYKN